MRKRTFLKTLALATIAAWMTAASHAQDAPKTGYAEVNGINYYYEITGTGQPLLLLHGGFGTMDMFGPVRTTLAETRQVIAVDLHGHGRTALGQRRFDVVAQGDDMAGLLKAVGVEQADVMGYSMGSYIAMQFAFQHPDMVRRLLLVSAPFARDGYFPEALPQGDGLNAAAVDAIKGSPMYETYMAVAPVKDDFPRLLDEVGAWVTTPYDWSEDVKQLTMPVMLVFADSDMFRPEHMVAFYQLLGGGQKPGGWLREGMSQNRLAVLPNVTHFDLLMAPQLVPTVLPFLDGES